MDNQTHSLLTDAESSLRTFSRRKLLYANGRINQRAAEDDCTPETDRGESLRLIPFCTNTDQKERKSRSKRTKMYDGIVKSSWLQCPVNLKSFCIVFPVAKEAGDAFINRLKKRKWKEGSPLLEMPDLSQADKVFSQDSPCSSDCLSAPLDSPQVRPGYFCLLNGSGPFSVLLFNPLLLCKMSENTAGHIFTKRDLFCFFCSTVNPKSPNIQLKTT